METLKYKVIRSKEQYNKYCKMLEILLDSGSKSRIIADEIDLLTLLIEKWDEEHSTLHEVDPIRMLQSFMADHNIKAKDLAAEITSFNSKKNNLHGEQIITGEHIKNNKDVRNLLGKSGIKPELLPPEENIKKLSRRLKSEEKKIAKNVNKNLET